MNSSSCPKLPPNPVASFCSVLPGTSFKKRWGLALFSVAGSKGLISTNAVSPCEELPTYAARAISLLESWCSMLKLYSYVYGVFRWGSLEPDRNQSNPKFAARDVGRNVRHNNLSIRYDRAAGIIDNTGNAPSSVLCRHSRSVERAQYRQQ